MTSANVSNIRIEQNGNEALTERRPMRDGRRTGDMCENRKIRFCNITDECKTSPDDFDNRKGVIYFGFLASWR